MKSTLPWLTKVMLRSHIKKLNKMKKNTAEPTPSAEAGDALGGLEGATSRSNSSTLSPLTLDTGVLPSIGDNRRSGTGTGISDESAAPARTTEPTDEDAALFLVAGGRPKGSTLKSERDVKNREQLATFEAARVYKETINERRMDKVSTRLRNGELNTIIAHAKAKYNVDDHFSISKSTIRSRYKRDNLNPSTPQGTPSPMAAVEPYVVEVILQLARLRCPISASTGLYLDNSMIDGTELARNSAAKGKPVKATTSGTDTDTTRDSSLLSIATSSTLTTSIMTGRTAAAPVLLGTASGAPQQHNDAEGARALAPRAPTTTTSGAAMVLGSGYWNGFMRRHSHIIRSKRSVKFEAKRAEWCTYENFSDMYNHIYDAMVAKGIASKVDTNVFLNKEGSIVEFSEESFV